MKHLKHILAAMLTVFVAFALAIPAFAASITVEQDPADGTAGTETYVAYKIFDVTKKDGIEEPVTTDDTLGPGTAEGFAYSIAADSPWVSVLNTDTGKGYFTLTESADGSVYTVELVDGNNTEAKAKEIAAWLLQNKPSGVTGTTFTTGQTASVDDGYYLITSSLGTNLILATSDITITEKNQYVVDSKIAETASMTIGENATYYIKVFLPASIDTTKKVTVHDNLDDVFKFNNDVQVYVGDTDPGSTAADYKPLSYGALTSAYTVKTTGLTDDCDFEIEITTTDLAGKYLVFKYSAELTSAADADGDGYVNEEFSTYSDYKTEPSTPRVKTYDFDFQKTDGSNKLDGAKFELRATEDGAPIALLTTATGYKKADKDDTGTVTTIEVNSKTTGKVTNISGLGGTAEGKKYYLVETAAPKGFNKLTAPIICTVMDDGTMTFELDGKKIGDATAAFDVVNQTGTILPSTGGMGTTILYVVGGIMIVGAIVVLITKKRVKSIEK